MTDALWVAFIAGLVALLSSVISNIVLWSSQLRQTRVTQLQQWRDLQLPTYLAILDALERAQEEGTRELIAGLEARNSSEAGKEPPVDEVTTSSTGSWDSQVRNAVARALLVSSSTTAPALLTLEKSVHNYRWFVTKESMSGLDEDARKTLMEMYPYDWTKVPGFPRARELFITAVTTERLQLEGKASRRRGLQRPRMLKHRRNS